MTESVQRLQEIEQTFRDLHRDAAARAKRLESGEGKLAAYERGLAYAYDTAANHVAGEIAEVLYA